MEFKLNDFLVLKALLLSDGHPGDPEVLYKEWIWAKSVAIVKPGLFREIKSSLLHDLVPSNEWSSDDLTIYKRMKTWISTYGRDSITFNSLIRTVSIAMYSLDQVQRKRLSQRGTPPAFDSSFRAAVTDKRKAIRKELEDWICSTDDPWIREIRDSFSKVINFYEKFKQNETVILTNGTTTGIEWLGLDLTDIMGIVFKPKGWSCPWTGLVKFLRIDNNYLQDKPLHYVEFESSDKYPQYGGEHMVIPDKDGKEREVYRLYPWYQTVSKAVHEFLDKVVHNLEGNYSYNHREWLRNIVSCNYHKTKYIIGTDMSKYSDTLDRSFIMFVLKAFGLNKELIDELEDLYSPDIFDRLLLQGYSGLQSSLQGQYGDFPLITLCNLVIQAFLYHYVSMPCKEGYRAAVGDDTGMIFDYYDPSIREAVVEVYGSVGVNINKEKTSEIIPNGTSRSTGRIEFVKLELTSDGIVDFLNMRAVHTKNIDIVIKSILELENKSEHEKFVILEQIFGTEYSNRIVNLSIINGGLKDDPISEKDIGIYYNRCLQLSKLIGYSEDDTRIFLDKLESYLEENCYDDVHITDTALIGWMTKEEIDTAYDKGQDLVEALKLKILNMVKLGLSYTDGIRSVGELLGYRPSSLKENFKKMQMGLDHDPEMARLGASLESFDSQASLRRVKDKLNEKHVSFLVPIMMGLMDGVEDVIMPDFIYRQELHPNTVAEYEEFVIPYKGYKNLEVIKTELDGIAEIYLVKYNYFGSYWYIEFETETGVIKRRLYDVEHNSKYELFTEDDFDKYIAPRLKGVQIGYRVLIDSWLCSRRAIQANWVPLAKCSDFKEGSLL